MGLPPDMVVELGEHDLTVSVRGLAVRRLDLGGATTAAAPGDSVPAFPAHWNDAKIVAEFETRRGGRVAETWELNKDGSELTVRTELPAMGERSAMEVKRVYERSDSQ